MGFSTEFKSKYGTSGVGNMSQEEIDAQYKKLEESSPESKEILYQYGLLKRPKPPGTWDKVKSTVEDTVKNPGTIVDRLASEPAAFIRGYKTNAKGVRRSELGYKLLTGTATEQDKKEIDTLGFQIKNELSLQQNDPYEARAAASLAPSIVKSLEKGGKGALIGATIGAIGGAIFPFPGGAPAGAKFGGEAGALMGGVEYAREIEAGNAYLEMKDIGINDTVAKTFSHLYGIGSAGLEITGMKYLKYIIPGGKKITSSVFKTALDKSLEAMSGKTTRAVGGALLGSGAEAGVEATQQLLQNVLTEIAAQVSDRVQSSEYLSTESPAPQKIGAQNTKQLIYNIQKDVVDTFAMTLIGMGITSIPGVPINILTDTKAGRQAVKDAVEENPEAPPEETIKKKAAETAKKKSRLQDAMSEHEKKRLEELNKKTKKQAKKVEKEVPPPVTKAPPEPAQAGFKEAPYEEPPNRPSNLDRYIAAIDAKMKEFQESEKEKAQARKERLTTENKPVERNPKILAPIPNGLFEQPKTDLAGNKPFPIKDIFDTVTEGNETKASPDLNEFIQKYGGNKENNEYLNMVAREKVPPQNKLTQPAILLKDGTIVEGKELSQPWFVSKANDAVTEEISNSFESARKQAMLDGKDLSDSVVGFVSDGGFVPSKAVVEKYNIGKNITKQKEKIQTKTEKKFTKEAESLQKKRDAWAKKVQEYREPTETDTKAIEKLDKAALNAAASAHKTNLGKHIDKSDLQSAVREAMWMLTLGKDPQEIQDYVDGKNRPLYGWMKAAITNQLKTFKKEDIAQKIGGNRSQVDTALNQGNLHAPAELNENITTEGEQVGNAPPVKMTEPYIPSDYRPGRLKDIDPKTGLTIRTLTPAEFKAEQLKKELTSNEKTVQTSDKPSKPVRVVKKLTKAEKKVRLSELNQEKVKSQLQVEKTHENFTGGKVPQQGSIFDQVKKQHEQVTKAAEEKDTNKPYVKEVKAEDIKTGNEFLDSMLGEKGGAGIINAGLEAGINKYKQWRNKWADVFDVEDKWERFGHGAFGTALKNMWGKITSYEKREVLKLMNFGKLVHKVAPKITNDELVDCLLAAETPALMKDLPAGHKQIAEWIRKYFDDSEQEFAGRGIDISFKRRRMAELVSKYLDETDWDNWQSMQDKFRKGKGPLSKIWELENSEFVHIPREVIAAFLEASKGKEFRREFGKRISKLEFKTAKKRQSIRIANLIDNGVITKGDINVYELLGSYMRKKANDFAVTDLRDVAIKEGLIKVSKKKPKSTLTEFKKLSSVAKEFYGLGYYNQKAGDVWIDTSIVSALQDARTSVNARGKWAKIMVVSKMLQFYNPLFLPAYDLLQHIMLGPAKLWRLPGNVVKSFYQVFTFSDDYLIALENGLASVPFGISFDEYMNIVHRAQLRGKMSGVSALLVEAGSRMLAPMKDGKLRIPIITGAYESSYQLAWFLDNVVRMMSYNYLRKEGHSELSAAQTAAKFHGDYASVPAKTRQKLNNIFFTPTFQIAMVKLFKHMATNLIKTYGGFKRAGTTKAQRRMAYAALTTGTLMLAQEVLLHSMGFDTEDWNRRYVKRVYDNKGNRKELVLTISTPMNVPFRLYNKLISPFSPEVTNPVDAFFNAVKWTLNPAIQTVLEIKMNRAPDGSPIYGSLDSGPVKLTKIAAYGTKRLVAMLNLIQSDEGQTISSQESKRQLIKMYGKFWGYIIPKFAFAYLRDPADVRKAGAIQNLGNKFVYEAKQELMNERTPPISEWNKNYMKRFKEIMKE